MDRYVEGSIERLINDSKILIVPENLSVEDALQQEDQLLLADPPVTVMNFLPDDNDLDFERMYQFSKSKKMNQTIPEPIDFSYLKTGAADVTDGELNPENLLLINRTLKERLMEFRGKISVLLEKISKQTRAHNLRLEEAKSGEVKDHAAFKSSYVKCGAPFFKDATLVPAPFNDDYKQRKTEGKEYFPFDWPKRNSRWKMAEKVELVLGVKKQMVNHIKCQQSLKTCETTKSTRGKLQKLKFMNKNTDFNDASMLEIYENIQKNHPDFQVNWNLISFSDLDSKHSVTECMGMWYSYLRPDLNREPFSEEENAVMSAVFTENEFQDWNYVASMLKNRSALQTFVHFHTIYTQLCANNVRWSEKEDEELMDLIDKFSVNHVVNWRKVGQLMPMRNRIQCYNRFQILARMGGYQKGRFTSNENRLIIEYVEKYGEEKLKKLPKNFLPGRSNNQIRNQYMITLKHRGDIKPWTREEDRMLVELVEKQKKVNWRTIADVLKTHNRISCRTRFMIIQKFLKNHPGKELKDVPVKFKKATVVARLADDESNPTVSKKVLPTAAQKTEAFQKFKKANQELVSMMSTSYNLDFSRHTITVEPTLFHTVLALLGHEAVQKAVARRRHFFTGEQQLTLSKLCNEQKPVRPAVKAINKSKADFRVPPNLNTALGIRAVMIRKQEEDKDAEFVVTDPSEKYKLALKAFQQLYFKLFYWSAMLHKIDSEELNLAHFEKCRQPIASSHQIFNKLNNQYKRSATDAEDDSPLMKKLKN